MKIVTGDDLREARARLGMTLTQMGEALRLKGRDVGSRVRRMEVEDDVSGPVAVAVEGFLYELDREDSRETERERDYDAR